MLEQNQSLFFTLPGEIRNAIYDLIFITSNNEPITDVHFASTSSAVASPHQTVPPLGLSVFATCKRVLDEAPSQKAYTGNTFRFTSVSRLRGFSLAVPKHVRHLVEDVEIDVRELSRAHPQRSREWTEHLFYATNAHSPSIGSFKVDLPGIKTLRLNFEAWPRIDVVREELWFLLKRLLLHVRGLERVVVSGWSRGEWMAKQDPWSAVHYAGSDAVGKEELIEWMCGAVLGKEDAVDGEDKLVSWHRNESCIAIEVCNSASIPRHVSLGASRALGTGPIPRNGTCTVGAYNERREAVPGWKTER